MRPPQSIEDNDFWAQQQSKHTGDMSSLDKYFDENT